MPNNKTPEEDFKRFEDFVDAMEDLEYEIWINTPFDQGGASDKQRRLALELRTPVDEDEVDKMMLNKIHESATAKYYGLKNYRSDQ